jgi:hypothetical protein
MQDEISFAIALYKVEYSGGKLNNECRVISEILLVMSHSISCKFRAISNFQQKASSKENLLDLPSYKFFSARKHKKIIFSQTFPKT